MTLVQAAPSETAHESGGYVKGVAIAVVTQNKDEEGLCRVKVRFPWREDSSESYWARLATPMAGKERGFVTIPEVGDEVLVAFEREDIRFPHVLGGLFNGKDKSAVANTDGKNDKREWRSRKKHYLRFDDGAQGVVELAHEKKRRITFDDNGFSIQDENGNVVKVDSTSGAMTIEAKGQLTIKGMTISIQSTGTLELKAGGAMTIQGALVNIN